MTFPKRAIGLTRRQLTIGGAAIGATLASGAGPALIRAQDQVEIKLAHPTVNAEWDKNLESLVNQFMEATPGIKVTVEHRPADQYWDKLQTEFAGGQAPDVSSINMDWTVPGASRGMFVDLKPLYERDQVDLSDLWYNMEPEWGYEGGMYGGILYAGGQNLYVNKTILEAGGLTMPTAEWTWDDLLEAGKALTKADAGQYGIASVLVDVVHSRCGRNGIERHPGPMHVGLSRGHGRVAVGSRPHPYPQGNADSSLDRGPGQSVHCRQSRVLFRWRLG
jgi:multiple sugar transport system substrate-binding protein